MKQFLILLFAHLLADYPLQGDFLAKMKGERLIFMLTHCAIWTGCIVVALHICAIDVTWFMLVFLFTGHWLLDTMKCNKWFYNFPSADPLGWLLWIDQLLHVGQLALILQFFKG